MMVVSMSRQAKMMVAPLAPVNSIFIAKLLSVKVLNYSTAFIVHRTIFSPFVTVAPGICFMALLA